jgi:hypothetical protein
MSQVSSRCVFGVIVLAFAALVPLYAQNSAAAPAAPDSTLYTTYSGSSTNLSWIVCGSTQETEGCYDSGSLGPFVGIGAMLESNPTVKGDVVTRELYIVDSGATAVKLYVYKKTDTVSSTFDTTTITLSKTISLPLTGGSNALASMAANNSFLFIGTNQGEQAVMVQKNNLAVSKVGIYILGINVTSITSDEYGYVTVTQTGSDGSSGFAVFGPNGEAQEDGGGANFVLGTTQAVPVSLLLSGEAPAAPRMGYHFKGAAGESK